VTSPFDPPRSAPPGLLIAGCGELGLELASQASAAGWRVLGLRRRPPPGPAPLTWIAGDVAALDPRRLPFAPDAVVYAVSAGGRELERYREAYLAGPLRLWTALEQGGAPAPRWLLVSSTAVWGRTDGGWVDEATPADPADPFAELLLAGETALAERAQARGARLSVCRAGGLYGPGRQSAIEAARRGRPLGPGADGRFTNRIRIEDAAAALRFVLERPEPAPCYALVDREPASELEFYRFLAQGLGLAEPRLLPVGSPSEPDLPGRSGNKRVRPSRLIEAGFRWRFPTYREGYGDLLRRGGRP
jgi:nucleoside-diphosphate-sugar epimerase